MTGVFFLKQRTFKKITHLKIHILNPKIGGLERWFSFLIGSFSGSMLVFGRVWQFVFGVAV